MDTGGKQTLEMAYDEVDAPMVRHQIYIEDIQDDGEEVQNYLGLDNLDSGKQEKTDKRSSTFRKIDLCFAIFSLITFSIDYVTDLKLMFDYYQNGQTNYFIWTLTSIVVPSVISGVLSLSWHFMERDMHSDNMTSREKIVDGVKSVCSFLQLGRIIRQTEYAIKVAKSFHLRHRIRHAVTEQEKNRLVAYDNRLRDRAIVLKRDSAILGLVDGFLESALQLLLQLFLMYSYDLPLTFLRVTFLCSAWISTALTHTSYYRANRKGQKEKKSATYLSSLFYFLLRLFELGPRYILLSLTLTYFLPWCLIAIPFHIIFVYTLFSWHKPQIQGICPKTGKCKGTCLEQLFLITISYLGIFCFTNLFEGKTRKPATIFYIVFYSENVLLTAAFVWYSHHNNTLSPKMFILLFIPIGLLCHLLFTFLFYKIFHPRISKNTISQCKCCTELE